MMWGQGRLSVIRRSRQHLFDLDRNPIAIDQHHAAGHRQIIGEDLDLVGLGGVQFDDGAAGTAAAPWWIGIDAVPRTTIRSTETLSSVGTATHTHKLAELLCFNNTTLWLAND